MTLGFLLTKIATQLVYPLTVVIALALLGLALLAFGRRRSAVVALALSLAILWSASTPVVAFLLNEPLETAYAPVRPEDAQPAEAIVLLGGAVTPAFPPRDWVDLNDAVDRIVHAARLYRAGKAPVVVPTGGGVYPFEVAQRPGDVMADLLVEWGVPRDAILVERESRNTYENAIFTKRVLDAHGISGPILLVTSAAHMWRSMLLFESAGMQPIAAPTDFELGRLRWTDAFSWLPDAGALRATHGALKEYLGVFVDRRRGRITVER
jgi:uncharacterized SAM-binding protein YcdF (DUF218 family)